MKSLNQLARVAFIAHWKRDNNITDEAAALSEWLALPYIKQAPWIEAARAVHEEVKHLH